MWRGQRTGAVCLLLLLLTACGGAAGGSQGDGANALRLSRDGDMILVEGLDCDALTVEGESLYLANPRFFKGLEKGEGSARWNPETDTLTATITKSTAEAGATTGPVLHFTVDCAAGALLDSRVEEYEGEGIDIPEDELLARGLLLGHLIKMCRSAGPVLGAMAA